MSGSGETSAQTDTVEKKTEFHRIKTGAPSYHGTTILALGIG